MYIIKKICVDDKIYLTSEIQNYATKISVALTDLQLAARLWVKECSGSKASDQCTVIDVLDDNSIVPPAVDGTYLYRLINNPHSIHVYQRSTEIVTDNGWFGRSMITQPSFKRTHIFELEDCPILSKCRDTSMEANTLEFVKVGPAGIKVPKNMTISPMCDVIEQLKSSDHFQHLKHKLDALEKNATP